MPHTFFVRYLNFDLPGEFASFDEAEAWALDNYKGQRNGWDILPTQFRDNLSHEGSEAPVRVRPTPLFIKQNPRKKNVKGGTLVRRCQSGLSWIIRWDGFKTGQLCPKSHFEYIEPTPDTATLTRGQP